MISPAVFLRLIIRLKKRSAHGTAHSPLWVGIVSVDNLGDGQTLASARFPTPTLQKRRREKQVSIWAILFVVLVIAWLGGFTVFHVAGGLIHLLLVLAVISLILHFVMGRRTT